MNVKGLVAQKLVAAGLIAVSSMLLCSERALAGPLDAITNAEAGAGLKAALERGANAAVAQLGQDGGFLNNGKVKIPLPSD